MNKTLSQKKIDVIIEARMTSSRLPGKVLLPAAGKPMLEHMVERTRRIPEISDVIIATTVNDTDEPIVALAKRLHVTYFCGDEDDVLGRVVKAAKQFGTEVIVEITGDDPLLDPELSSDVIKAFLERDGQIDYVANDIEGTFPIGWNTRAFPTTVLEAVEKKTSHPIDREHVVNYIVKHPHEFRMYNIAAEGMYRRPDIRLTLDTKADYEVMRRVFEALYRDTPAFTARDIIHFLDAHPEIKTMNSDVIQRTYRYE